MAKHMAWASFFATLAETFWCSNTVFLTIALAGGFSRGNYLCLFLPDSCRGGRETV